MTVIQRQHTRDLPMFHSERVNRITNRIMQGIVLAYQGLALVIFILVPFLADKYLRTPFIGAFVEQTLVFNGVGSGRLEDDWYLFQQVDLGDRLVGMDGLELRSTADLVVVLQHHAVNDTVPI